MKYSVVVTRTSLYYVEADTEEAAIDRVLDGEVEESPGGETTGVQAFEETPAR